MKLNFKFLIIILLLIVIAAGIYFAVHYFKKFNEQAKIPPAPSESPLEGKPLPPEKEAIKQSLIAPLGEAGTLTDGPDFKIDYIAPDIFEVEIKTTYVARARDEAVQWFKDKGFSEEDICNLPVTFYLRSDILKQLKGSGITYKLLPDFCQ